MKSVAGKLRLELGLSTARWPPSPSSASDLDKATQMPSWPAVERMTELLKQPQYSPMSMQEQVVVIYAGNNGYVDDYPHGRHWPDTKKSCSRLHEVGKKSDILDALFAPPASSTRAWKRTCAKQLKDFALDLLGRAKGRLARASKTEA